MKGVVLFAASAGLATVLGCRASMTASADANVSGEGASAEADGSAELEGQGELTRRDGAAALVAADTSSPEALGSSRVLLGARHDLKLRPGKATASCECLNVALGGSQSEGMMWSDTPPAIDDATQLSIALSSDGVSCKSEPKGSLGASYWGYRISGNDVIVLVEAARGGRPLTSGAIIPRPVGGGQVLVAPASKKLPYGRPLEGKGACKIGNPGQARSGAFSELELGVNAPATPASSNPTGADDPTTIEMPTN